MESTTPVSAPKRSRKWLKRAAFAIAFLLVLWLLASLAVAYRLTRRARHSFPEPVPVGYARIEQLRLSTGDGEDLGAWYMDTEPGRPVVVVLHGNNSCRSGCLREADMLSGAGYSVLLVSLRAHGDSTGDTNDFGLSARHDVVAAVEWIEAHHPGQRIAVWGQSLGAAAALYAAESLGNRVNVYIFECPYKDVLTAARNRTATYLPRPFSWVAYAGLVTVAPLFLNIDEATTPFRAADGMPATARVLVLAGGSDTRATPDEAKALAQRLGDRSEIVVIEGADHLQLGSAQPKQYHESVIGFLGRVLGEPSTHP